MGTAKDLAGIWRLGFVPGHQFQRTDSAFLVARVFHSPACSGPRSSMESMLRLGRRLAVFHIRTGFSNRLSPIFGSFAIFVVPPFGV